MAICLWLLGAGVTMYGLSSAAWSSFGNMSLAAWRGMAINLSLAAWSRDDNVWLVFSCGEQ